MAGDLVERLSARAPLSPEHEDGDLVARAAGVSVSYGAVRALDRVDLEIHAGTITALMGRNGSGKSTLLAGLAGMRPADAGSFVVLGRDPGALSASERIASVGLVPQEPGSLLYAQSVGAECSTADSEHGLEPGTTRAALDRIVGGLEETQHPRDLSEGQRLSLALGVVLAASPRLLLLDEPTRGLDYDAKRSLVDVLRTLKADGVAVVLATHDVELVAMVADRAIVLAQGELIADGPARDVVCHTPAFAPQVAKVLSPQTWLTVSEVEEALCRPAS
jgi:energy-coupling factor transport system ATP-binding protein